MGLPEQLSAMLFELRSAGSPVAKAKALARAWRFVRRLSPQDRQFLAREAGFEGAEELLDNIAEKRGGVAPAMLVQLLGSLRDRGDQELATVIEGLKNPESREAILMRGADALVEALAPEASGADEVFESTPDTAVEVDEEPDNRLATPMIDKDQAVGVESAVASNGAQGRILESEAKATEADPETEKGKPKPVLADSVPAPVEADIEGDGGGSIDVGFLVEDLESQTSLVERLLCLREATPALKVGASELEPLVQAFPEGWPRRRALTALLEAGLPEDPDEALTLIDGLERPVDRRWCLAILVDRFDLKDDHAERVLEMTDSATLHRRMNREKERWL